MSCPCEMCNGSYEPPPQEAGEEEVPYDVYDEWVEQQLIESAEELANSLPSGGEAGPATEE